MITINQACGGDVTTLWGDVTTLRGDVTTLRATSLGATVRGGDVTYIRHNSTIFSNMYDCNGLLATFLEN